MPPKPGKPEDKQRINEQIRVPSVRLIGDAGAQLGIMTTDLALAEARKAGLDLVEVAPHEKPPVCRIMDFGKFKYQQKKRQHKGHAHQIKIKEIRLRPKTGEHDLMVKVTHAREFLEHKNKVVVTVVYRGRELAHMEEGRKVLNQLVARLEDVGKVESLPLHQGRKMICTIAPK